MGRGHPLRQILIVFGCEGFATNTERLSGRGSVWLERLLWEQEVDSSSLSAPTSLLAIRWFDSLTPSYLFVGVIPQANKISLAGQVCPPRPVYWLFVCLTEKKEVLS